MKREYDFSKMKEIPNPYKEKVKRSIGINLSPEVIDYFKKMSAETTIPYQRLIDMYLLDCVKKQRKLNLQWAGGSG